MRKYLCFCLKCKTERLLDFDEPFPLYGDVFKSYCQNCLAEEDFTRVLTRKAKAELNIKAEEDTLKKRISDRCALYGFTTRQLFQSIVIQTPKAEWSFDYHKRLKTLLHESTYPFSLKTGAPAKAHIQFKDRKLTIEEIIDYIARHDGVSPKE